MGKRVLKHSALTREPMINIRIIEADIGRCQSQCKCMAVLMIVTNVMDDQITGLWFELQRFSISIREVSSGLASSPGSRCAQQCTQPPAVGVHAPYSCTHIGLHDIHPILASSTQPPDVAPVRGSAPQRISLPPPSPSPSPSRHHHHHHRSPERELLHQPDCPHLRFREESLDSVNVPTENGFFALMKYTTASSRVCFKLRRSYIRR
jgi:hypothetical protein